MWIVAPYCSEMIFTPWSLIEQMVPTQLRGWAAVWSEGFAGARPAPFDANHSDDQNEPVTSLKSTTGSRLAATDENHSDDQNEPVTSSKSIAGSRLAATDENHSDDQNEPVTWSKAASPVFTKAGLLLTAISSDTGPESAG
jgi:hypothetical protein